MSQLLISRISISKNSYCYLKHLIAAEFVTLQQHLYNAERECCCVFHKYRFCEIWITVHSYSTALLQVEKYSGINEAR